MLSRRAVTACCHGVLSWCAFMMEKLIKAVEYKRSQKSSDLLQILHTMSQIQFKPIAGFHTRLTAALLVTHPIPSGKLVLFTA